MRHALLSIWFLLAACGSELDPGGSGDAERPKNEVSDLAGNPLGRSFDEDDDRASSAPAESCMDDGHSSSLGYFTSSRPEGPFVENTGMEVSCKTDDGPIGPQQASWTSNNPMHWYPSSKPYFETLIVDNLDLNVPGPNGVNQFQGTYAGGSAELGSVCSKLPQLAMAMAMEQNFSKNFRRSVEKNPDQAYPMPIEVVCTPDPTPIDCTMGCLGHKADDQTVADGKSWPIPQITCEPAGSSFGLTGAAMSASTIANELKKYVDAADVPCPEAKRRDNWSDLDPIFTTDYDRETGEVKCSQLSLVYEAMFAIAPRDAYAGVERFLHRMQTQKQLGILQQELDRLVGTSGNAAVSDLAQLKDNLLLQGTDVKQVALELFVEAVGPRVQRMMQIKDKDRMLSRCDADFMTDKFYCPPSEELEPSVTFTVSNGGTPSSSIFVTESAVTSLTFAWKGKNVKQCYLYGLPVDQIRGNGQTASQFQTTLNTIGMVSSEVSVACFDEKDEETARAKVVVKVLSTTLAIDGILPTPGVGYSLGTVTPYRFVWSSHNAEACSFTQGPATFRATSTLTGSLSLVPSVAWWPTSQAITLELTCSAGGQTVSKALRLVKVVTTTGSSTGVVVVAPAPALAPAPTPASGRAAFSFVSGEQTFVVPAGVTSILVKAWGAGGGGGEANGLGDASHHGGGGAFASARLAVTPGETLNVIVGGGGVFGYRAGSGGGRSAVRRQNLELLTAAGGGGAGCVYRGGAGGALVGLSGNSQYGGGGGTQTLGGAGGSGSIANGATGASFRGGDGGGYYVIGAGAPGGFGGGGASGNDCGGGGGGGYFGGGGGARHAIRDGGGGGGSSFVPAGGVALAGAERTAGGAGDADRGGDVGNGGAAMTNGSNGHVVLSW